MEPLLTVNKLSVVFDTSIQRINAVDHVSLHVNHGEIVGIIGESGSGKSSLAKTILGLFAKNQTTKGQLYYQNFQDKLDLLQQSKVDWQRFRKGTATMVFQNPLLNLNPSSTIKAHFDRAIELYGHQNGKAMIKDALQDVGLAHDRSSILSAYPHQLSGGQQQRVLIALAICQQVKLLLLDEPMSSLDKQNQEGITEILIKLVEEKNLSIVLISHDLNIIGALANRIYVMKNGQMLEDGPTERVLNSPTNNYTLELLAAKSLGQRQNSKADCPKIIDIKSLSHTYNKGGFLSLSRSTIDVLKDVYLSIKKSSVTGLVGSSGSGKTTLVKVLMGIEKLQIGEIYWYDSKLRNLSHEYMCRKIQIIPQNTADALNPKMLIDNQLKEVYRKYHSNETQYTQVIQSLLIDVNLDTDLRFRYPSELSGGEIQRMAIVRALMLKPEVLILDESLSALDMVVQKRLVDLILDLNHKLDMTIIMISHDDRLVSGCCDYVYQLSGGQVVPM